MLDPAPWRCDSTAALLIHSRLYWTLLNSYSQDWLSQLPEKLMIGDTTNDDKEISAKSKSIWLNSGFLKMLQLVLWKLKLIFCYDFWKAKLYFNQCYYPPRFKVFKVDSAWQDLFGSPSIVKHAELNLCCRIYCYMLNEILSNWLCNGKDIRILNQQLTYF